MVGGPFGRFVHIVGWCYDNPGATIRTLTPAFQACQAAGQIRDAGRGAGKDGGGYLGNFLRAIPPGLLYALIYDHLIEWIGAEKLDEILDAPTEFHLWESEDFDPDAEKKERAAMLGGMKANEN